jgi:hypothetical protein
MSIQNGFDKSYCIIYLAHLVWLMKLRKKCDEKYMILAIMFRPFDFIAPKTLSYLSFQSFDFERS